MVVKEDGKYCTMRENPKMASIATSVHGNAVHLEAPGMPEIKVSTNPAIRNIIPSCRYTFLQSCSF